MNRAKLLAAMSNLPLRAGIVTAGAVWLLLQSFAWVEQDRRHQVERAVTQAEAATVRARLESELNATLSLSLGLSAFVLTKPDFSEDDLAQVAASLIRLQPAIRSVALAPDNVIRYIYPHAGNEKALGLRYMDTPSQRDAVLRLMLSQRPVIAGPVELVQGGLGIINRIPIVFRRPGGSPYYWGLASMAIDPLPIFERAGIQAGAGQGDIRYALRGRDGKGAQGEVFLGDATLFRNPDTVLMDVIIPGGTWQLAARKLTSVAPYGVWAQVLIGMLAVVAGMLAAFTLSAHQRVRSLAQQDGLTGLANRHQFNLRGQHLFALAKRSQRPLTLLNLDIDDFKLINDSYGHAAGDSALIQFADILRACCRQSDLLARMGGDEFLVLLPDTSSLDALLNRLRASAYVTLPGTDAPRKLSISIGVATCSDSTATLESLMHEADVAMYRAKEESV